MKKIFSILILALSCSALFAQQTAVALLNHEGTISTFYGSDALTQAHKAAVHGDIITLSGGAFTAPSSWVKAVTLRGAGCYAGSDNSREVTSIGNEFKLAIPVEIETTMTIEGINFKSRFYFTTQCANTTFIKCNLASLREITRNTNFYQCIANIDYWETKANSTYCANINFVNCYIKNMLHYNSQNGSSYAPQYASYNLTNCVVKFTEYRTYSYASHLNKNRYVNYKNCILLGYVEAVDTPSSFAIDMTCSATNCLSCYCVYKNATETEDAIYDYNIFDNIGNSTNKYLEEGKPIHETISSVFKTYNGTDDFSFNELYELTDEAKAMYIGSDGTQIGLHGGIGFDLVPSTLQITKCEVAPRSTKDGKLSVKIEVGIPE